MMKKRKYILSKVIEVDLNKVFAKFGSLLYYLFDVIYVWDNSNEKQKSCRERINNYINLKISMKLIK